MVEVLDLLAEDEVLEQRRASRAGLQANLVFDGAAHIRSEVTFAVVHLELLKDVV